MRPLALIVCWNDGNDYVIGNSMMYGSKTMATEAYCSVAAMEVVTVVVEATVGEQWKRQ